MSNRLQFVERTVGGAVQRLAVSDLASIYGCCGFFDMCGDGDLMSLSFAGTQPFLDILNFQPSNVCKIRKEFLTWVKGGVGDVGRSSHGVIADPCGDPYGVAYGTCSFELEDFGRLRTAGPVRDITKLGLKLCENSPRYRLDGAPITDDMEYGIRLATEGLMQDLLYQLVHGTNSLGGSFEGLEHLVISGYTSPDGHKCKSMDSIVVDWNHNSLDGGAGMTWNGAAIAATFNFIDVLLAAYRRIRDRIGMAPALGGGLTPGDMVLVMPTALARCLLDAYTCWSVCTNASVFGDVGSSGPVVGLNSFEARRFRETLNGGMFGAGKIFLDGFEIPIVPFNSQLINGPTAFDAYLLTLKVGGVRLVEGQYNDMRNIPSITGLPSGVKVPTDGGRLLTWLQADHTCMQSIVEMQPRLLMWAPWAQARFMDVVCAGPVGPLSPDPDESSFFPESSFITAECPEDEVQA
jgi:hypothetical protein